MINDKGYHGMMEFSCHTWGFTDLTLTEALGTIARLGFRYVDIGTGTHVNIARSTAASTREGAIADVREDLDTFNLKVADFYLMLPRISVDDLAKREIDLKTFKALLPFIKGIGAQGITVSAGLIHPVSDEGAFQRTVEALSEMLQQAQKVGLPFSIEPHLDSMAQTPAQALRLVEAVAGLQITLDWAHMACQKVKTTDILALLPHTRHVQIRQAMPNKLQVPLDKGKIDLGEVMTALKSAGYAGMISIETLQTVGWHGAVKVNNHAESVALRDALRDLR